MMLRYALCYVLYYVTKDFVFILEIIYTRFFFNFRKEDVISLCHYLKAKGHLNLF